MMEEYISKNNIPNKNSLCPHILLLGYWSNLLIGEDIWIPESKYPPQIATQAFLVPFCRKFCLVYCVKNHKKSLLGKILKFSLICAYFFLKNHIQMITYIVHSCYLYHPKRQFKTLMPILPLGYTHRKTLDKI